MKKLIALSLLICMLVLNSITVSADTITDFPSTYEPSTGGSYSPDDYTIYLEDFEGQEFNSSQEVIDFVYYVGETRINSRSTQDYYYGYTLTSDEIELFIEYFYYIGIVVLSKTSAEEKTAQLYPNNHSDGQLGNAFQHAYWTMYLCRHTSPSFALEFVTAHENYPDNPLVHKYMDLHNNETSYYHYVNNNLASQNYSNDELASVVQTKMENGDYIYIVFNYPYISHSIYYVATGQTVNTTSYGDFHAYTNSTVPFEVPETVYEVVPVRPGDLVVKP